MSIQTLQNLAYNRFWVDRCTVKPTMNKVKSYPLSKKAPIKVNKETFVKAALSCHNW